MLSIVFLSIAPSRVYVISFSMLGVVIVLLCRLLSSSALFSCIFVSLPSRMIFVILMSFRAWVLYVIRLRFSGESDFVDACFFVTFIS